jgi:hypothetical protein
MTSPSSRSLGVIAGDDRGELVPLPFAVLRWAEWLTNAADGIHGLSARSESP